MEKIFLNTGKEINLSGGKAPDWIPLLPAGPDIEGRDGRMFRMPDPQLILDAFVADGADLPVDWEHETEGRRAGRVATAGWIKQLEIRAGAIWGKVTWTVQGREDVAGRIYRYISPVIQFREKSRIVIKIISAALTHRPNLRMPALNRQQENIMENMEKVTEALGLRPGADAEIILTAVNKMKADIEALTAKNAENVENAKAENAKAKSEGKAGDAKEIAAMKEQNETLKKEQEQLTKQLHEMQSAWHGEKASAALDAAIGAGKILPSARDYYAAQCQDAAGLESFEKFVAQQPVLLGGRTELPASPSSRNSRDIARQAATRQAELAAQGIKRTLTECVDEVSRENDKGDKK